MKLINKNQYNIMFGMEFIKAGEVKDVDDKIAQELLKQPNIEEFIDKEQAKALEEENAKLKDRLSQIDDLHRRDIRAVKEEYQEHIAFLKEQLRVWQAEHSQKKNNIE